MRFYIKSLFLYGKQLDVIYRLMCISSKVKERNMDLKHVIRLYRKCKKEISIKNKKISLSIKKKMEFIDLSIANHGNL